VSKTKKWLLALALCLSAATASLAPTAAFAAPPSVNDVEAAIARGDMGQAQSMLDQVIAAHPKSARAHYLDAQVLERNRRYADALSHINTARSLDPSIGFTDRSRFEAVARRISAEAGQANSRQNQASVSTTPSQNNTAMAVAPGVAAAPAVHHGPSTMLWIILLLVVVGIIVVIRWGMRKRSQTDDAGSVDMQRGQLKRATELMDAVRAAKLDLRLSTAPEKQSWVAEADDVEAQLRTLIDSLSGGGNRGFGGNQPSDSPAYLLESLSARVERLQALAAGRPDPMTHGNPNDPRSPYANEADRMSANPYGQQPGWQQPPQQQPQVIVQQQPAGGGLGAGLGGLLGGVMLGEMLGGNRERDVIVEHDRTPQQAPQQDAGGGSPFDFGNGGDNWGGGDGSQIDAGNDDNSWDDNS